MQERRVAIITARGGSKRIPRKNIKPFLGIPIIKYVINAALQAQCFDEMMVSTDDEEIADVARQCGANVPFFRSSATSNDFATTADVLHEVLVEYCQRRQEFDMACCIYPTAVFVTGEQLRAGLRRLQETDVDVVIPVVRFSSPIQRAFHIENGTLGMIWPEYRNVRSQDIPPAYHDAGQFYWVKVASFLEQKTLFARHTVALELSESAVQDIDTLADWNIAEMKYRMMRSLL